MVGIIVAVSLTLFSLLSYRVYCERHEYIVNTKQCKIANLQPFNEETTDLFIPRDYLNCSDLPLLTYITKINNTAILHMQNDVIKDYSSEKVDCCYANITRDVTWFYPDHGIKISDCIIFQNQVILKHDNIMVKCGTQRKLLYENIHNPIIIKNSVKEKLKQKKGNPISVLVIVIDSISRLNAIRTMPETYRFLFNNNFIELKGYIKTADNTFPNFMAMLTGYSLNQTFQSCSPYRRSNLDQCPLIWYDYRNLGYVTAYAEDFDSINTFTYDKKKGFTTPPTDYYFKSHMAAAERLKTIEAYGMPFCTGPESSGERILNLAKDFSETFRNDPSFGIFWMNTFSHNELNCPSMMDLKMEEFFKYLKESGLLDDRIVIFMSDHGIRFGDIRLTRSGWLEERMPLNMISVPKKFQQEFRTEYEYLKENSKKLTNHYDLFMTLQHVLTLSGLSYQTKPSAACPKCTSLFRKIPYERSCRDAGIPPEWCTCVGFFQSINSENRFVKNATKYCNHELCTKIDFTNNSIISSSISEIDYNDGSRYVYIALQTIDKQTYLMTVKFKNYIDSTSFYHVFPY